MIIGPKMFTARLRDRIKKSVLSTSTNAPQEPKSAPRILVGRPVMLAAGLAAIVIASSVGVNYLFMSIFSKKYLAASPIISKMEPVEEGMSQRLAANENGVSFIQTGYRFCCDKKLALIRIFS